MKARAVQALCVAALLAASRMSAADYAPAFASQAPGLDANAAGWQDVPALKLDTQEHIEFKAIAAPSCLAVMVKWDCKQESRVHSPWKWDSEMKCYRPGDEVEDAFTLLVSQTPSAEPYEAWVWRAGRTDPARRADLLTAAPGGTLRFDASSSCWTQKAPGPFAGATIPRFVQRAPSGEAVKLHAKGEWRDGAWTVVFLREGPISNELYLKLTPQSKEPEEGCASIRLKLPHGGGAAK